MHCPTNHVNRSAFRHRNSQPVRRASGCFIDPSWRIMRDHIVACPCYANFWRLYSSQLVATLHQAQSAVTRVTAPVKIERFDNLSSWDIFQIPRLVKIVGADHLAQMSVVLPVTCVGPLDPITILVNIASDPDWPKKSRKIRVNKIQVWAPPGGPAYIERKQVSIEEVVTLKPPSGDEIITKKKRVLRTEQDCSGVRLDVSGVLTNDIANVRSEAASPGRSEQGCRARRFRMSEPGLLTRRHTLTHCRWALRLLLPFTELIIN